MRNKMLITLRGQCGCQVFLGRLRVEDPVCGLCDSQRQRKSDIVSLLTSASDGHLISPDGITPESNIKVMRIRRS